MVERREKIAVILLNLGGPDSLKAVKPFLTNLFSDRAIINVPLPIRWLLARFIAWRRTPAAKRIYDQIGGASPLLKHTEAQGQALAEALTDLGEVRCFISMRYWHPMSDATVEEVKRFAPERVVLLPLYPQFSRTTTGSSFDDWQDAAIRAGLNVPTAAICCYPTIPDYVAALGRGVRAAMNKPVAGKPLRILFSAHGLPKNIVESGDPYQWQIEQTAAAVVKKIDIPNLDWVVCYQSRVGPLEWLGPYTEDELRRAARDGVGVVVVPIAFVSEHSETLVELDIDYRQRAEYLGVPHYRRVPALGIEGGFISALACLVRQAVKREAVVSSGVCLRICPKSMRCPLVTFSGGADG